MPPTRPPTRATTPATTREARDPGHPTAAAAPGDAPAALLIDCEGCLVRGDACSDCVVSCLLGPPPPQGRRLDDDEVHAIDALSASGLVPPLRLVTALDHPRETDATYSA